MPADGSIRFPKPDFRHAIHDPRSAELGCTVFRGFGNQSARRGTKRPFAAVLPMSVWKNPAKNPELDDIRLIRK